MAAAAQGKTAKAKPAAGDAPLESPTLFAWSDVALAVIDPGRFAVGLRRGAKGGWLVQARATDSLADGAIDLLVRRSIPRIVADPALARQMYLDSAEGEPLPEMLQQSLTRLLQRRTFLPPLFRDEARCVAYRELESRRQMVGLLTGIDGESLSIVTAAGRLERVLKTHVAPGTVCLAEPGEIAGSLAETSFWDHVILNVALALQSSGSGPAYQQVVVLSQLDPGAGRRAFAGDRSSAARQSAWKLLTRQLGEAAGLSPGVGLTADLDRVLTERLQQLSVPVCDAAQSSRLVPDRPDQFLTLDLAMKLHATHVLSVNIVAEAAVPAIDVELIDLEGGRKLWHSSSLKLAADPAVLRQFQAVGGSLALIETADAALSPADFWEPEHVLAPTNWQRRRDHLVRIEGEGDAGSLRIRPLFGLQSREFPADSLKRRRDVTGIDDVPADLQLRYVLDHLLGSVLPPAAPILAGANGGLKVGLGSPAGVRPGDRMRMLSVGPAGPEWLAGELKVTEVREDECVAASPRTGLETWWPDVPAVVPAAYAVVRRSTPTMLGIVSPFYVNPDEKFPVVRKISQLKDRTLQQECFAQADQQTMQDAARLARKLTQACEQLRVPHVAVEGQQQVGARPNVDARAEALFTECVERGATHVLGGYLWPYDAAVSAKGVQMLKYRCKLAIKLGTETASSKAIHDEVELDLNRSHLGETSQ